MKSSLMVSLVTFMEGTTVGHAIVFPAGNIWKAHRLELIS